VLFKGALGSWWFVPWFKESLKIKALVEELSFRFYINVLLPRAQDARMHQRACHHCLCIETNLHSSTILCCMTDGKHRCQR
jgi:hypothetical protein